MKKKEKASNENTYMSRDEIIGFCKAPEASQVQPKGWPKPIRVQNVSFPEIVEIKKNAETPEDYTAAFIAAVCTDLTAADVYALQQENGVRVASLMAEIDNYLLNFDGKIKN